MHGNWRMKSKKAIWALKLIFLVLIPSLSADADIAELPWSMEFADNQPVLGICNWQSGSPAKYDWWWSNPQIKAPDGLNTSITWGFVTEWYSHFKILHDRIENLHLSEHEVQWLKRRRKELLDETQMYAKDPETWAVYQASWQMRKYRVSDYIHRNLETLHWVLGRLEQGGYQASIYQRLLSWSQDLRWRMPPYGDLAYFVDNDYMKPLTKKSKEGRLIGPLQGAHGYIWSREYTLESMNNFVDLGGKYTWQRTKYDRVHEFVKECIATELIRK